MKFFLRLFFILIFLSCSKKESEVLKELIYNVELSVSGNGTIDKDSGIYNLTWSQCSKSSKPSSFIGIKV